MTIRAFIVKAGDDQGMTRQIDTRSSFFAALAALSSGGIGLAAAGCGFVDIFVRSSLSTSGAGWSGPGLRRPSAERNDATLRLSTWSRKP